MVRKEKIFNFSAPEEKILNFRVWRKKILNFRGLQTENIDFWRSGEVPGGKSVEGRGCVRRGTRISGPLMSSLKGGICVEVGE